MFSRITSLVLVLALVLAGFWGYREHKEKQALLLKAENQYQRAFHDLSDHMNLLQDELGKSLAINSQKQRTPNLAEVWRISSSARNDVGELPLSLMPFNKTMEFLNDVGNFAYVVAVYSENKQALSDQEWSTLQKLYTRSKDLESQLADLQSNVIDHNLRWMDAELALSQTDKKTDNQIVDGFRAMEKKVESQEPLVFSPTLAGLKTRNKPNVNQLTGSDQSETQVAESIKTFFKLPDTKNIVVKKNGKGNNYPSYSVTAQVNGNPVLMTATIKGGHITWMMNNREIKGETYDLDQGGTFAMKFLKNHNLAGDEIVRTDTYDSVGVYDIVPVRNGARIYPQKLTLKVALDNGEVVGLNSQDYVFHQKIREVGEPKISEQTARKSVSNRVQVQEVHIAVVLDSLKKERLVYEFIGTMDEDTYKVYIDAQTGDEVGVEKM